MKKLGLGVVVFVFGCGSGASDPAGTANSSEDIALATYNFGALASPGKCLDVSGGGNADGTNVQQWQCNGSGAQSWRVEPSNGAYQLVNTPTGKCLDVYAAGTADGTNIQLYSCNGTGAQTFRIEDAGNSNVRIVNTNSNKCVDVYAAGTADGTNVQLYSCNGTNAQLWRPAQIAGGTVTPPVVTPPVVTPPNTGGWASLPARGDGKWVRVRNSCPFPIWVHGAGSSGVLSPDDAQLGTGQSRDYVAPNEWTAARVTAYGDGPRQTELDKAEMTLTGGVLNFNVTYVDWVGLPLEIVGVGGNCGGGGATTGCYAQESQITNGCPEGFLRDGKKCLSARTYCLNPVNQGNAYCHALDGAIASCPNCFGGSTADVYACAGNYAQQPRMCAALNRGMVNNPDSNNTALYYQNGPYNTYAKWVHQVCPNIYAFSYDDWQSQGGFRACSGDELRITFCPSG